MHSTFFFFFHNLIYTKVIILFPTTVPLMFSNEHEEKEGGKQEDSLTHSFLSGVPLQKILFVEEEQFKRDYNNYYIPSCTRVPPIHFSPYVTPPT